MDDEIELQFNEDNNSHSTTVELPNNNNQINIHVHGYDMIEHLDGLKLTMTDSNENELNMILGDNWRNSETKRDVSLAIPENFSSPLTLAITHEDENVLLDTYFKFTITIGPGASIIN